MCENTDCIDMNRISRLLHFNVYLSQEKVAPFQSAMGQHHNLTFLLWSPHQQHPLPSALFHSPKLCHYSCSGGPHSEPDSSRDLGKKQPFFWWGLPPATCVPAQLRRQGRDGAAAAQGQPLEMCPTAARLPAHPGRILPVPLPMRDGVGNELSLRLLHWKGPVPTQAVHLTFQFGEQGFFYSMAFSFLLPCSRVQKSFAEVSGQCHGCRLAKKWSCKK